MAVATTWLFGWKPGRNSTLPQAYLIYSLSSRLDSSFFSFSDPPLSCMPPPQPWCILAASHTEVDLSFPLLFGWNQPKSKHQIKTHPSSLIKKRKKTGSMQAPWSKSSLNPVWVSIWLRRRLIWDCLLSTVSFLLPFVLDWVSICFLFSFLAPLGMRMERIWAWRNTAPSPTQGNAAPHCTENRVRFA